MRPHRREDLITKLVPVAYDPAARCPHWLAFLGRIFDGKATLIGFLQRALGYALTGLTTEQVLFILWGAGANGKSTLLTSAVNLLADYALSTRPETFMVKQGDSIPNDVARLKDARLVIAVEADTGQRLDEGRVKAMTGNDPLSARFMRAEWFDFTPTFKVFLATNHRPVIRGHGKGDLAAHPAHPVHGDHPGPGAGPATRGHAPRGVARDPRLGGRRLSRLATGWAQCAGGGRDRHRRLPGGHGRARGVPRGSGA